MSTLIGNDVSKWQGNINFDIYKNNANFVIVKATEGTGFIDPQFPRNQSEARRVGLPHGYYHFARPDLGNSAPSEAKWFLEKLGAVREGELLVLDYEPTWTGDAVAWCLSFLKTIESELNGYKPLIYLNQSQVTGYNWQSVVTNNNGLWIAAYTFDPTKNTYKTGAWSFAAMQQWTNKQVVPGISGETDGNVFFGDMAVWKAYSYKKPVITPPDPCKDQLVAISKALELPDTSSLDTIVRSINATKGFVGSLQIQVIDLTQQVSNKIEEVSRVQEGLLNTIKDRENTIKLRDKELDNQASRIIALQEQITSISKQKDTCLVDLKKAQSVQPKCTIWQAIRNLRK